MDSYMASSGSCFMVTWTIFKNHLLEVGLTPILGNNRFFGCNPIRKANRVQQKYMFISWRETMALRTLTTVDLSYFIMCEDLHWNNIWLRARSHMTSHHTWGSVTTLHDLGGVLGRPLDTFIWALTISWSRLFGPLENFRLCGEKALKTPVYKHGPPSPGTTWKK